MMFLRLALGFSLMGLSAVASPAPAIAAKPLVGQYNCSAYAGNPPTAKPVGTFFIQPDNVYQVKDQPETGKYSFDNDKQMITWTGAPPFGYEVGVLEQPDRYSPPRLRLYPRAQDVGNVWKAAICYFQAVGKGQGGASSAPAGGATSYTVGAKVFVLHQGELLPAVITSMGVGRFSVRYEPNRYGLTTDDGVAPARLRPRS
jgi:hypothetical protein